MEGTETSATAVLVGPMDAGERPTAAAITVTREEIEEALAADDSPELIIEVKQGDAEPREVGVTWDRRDLEAVIAGTRAGGITFSFDPSELYRALEHPDFEGHGMREAIMLTVAAASASTAMAVGTASAGLVEGTSGSGSTTPAAAVASPSHDEASTASALAAASVVTPAHDEAATAATLATMAGTNDEEGLTARGIGITIPAVDETSLAARGIEQQPTPAIHDEATLVERGVVDAPVTVDSGSGLELPSVDPGTAALIGGLAGAGLLIVGGTFAARRRMGPA
jgi:hypothetical protein